MRTSSSRCPRCEERGQDSRGDNLLTWPDGSQHCFACNYHVHVKHYTPKKVDHVNKALLPFDFEREVPAMAWKWLLQYGLPMSHWKEIVGFSPAHQRLVFQVGTPFQFSIGRYVGTPKPGTKKWYVWGDCHKHAEILNDQGPTIVLVEDLISAHKVAEAGHVAIPLFGTQVHNPVLYYLLNSVKPVVLWLDKDQEGNVKKTAIRLQSIINRPVSLVVTDKDPKCLSLETIQESLNA